MHKTIKYGYLNAPVIRDTYLQIKTETNKHTHTTCGVNKIARSMV